MMKQELKEVILKKSVDRKISCASARNIAKSLGLSVKEVGAAADELGIKIHECELGCF